MWSVAVGSPWLFRRSHARVSTGATAFLLTSSGRELPEGGVDARLANETSNRGCSGDRPGRVWRRCRTWRLRAGDESPDFRSRLYELDGVTRPRLRIDLLERAKAESSSRFRQRLARKVPPVPGADPGRRDSPARPGLKELLGHPGQPD